MKKNVVYWSLVLISVATVLGINLYYNFNVQTFLQFWLVLVIIISPTVVSHFIESIYPKHWHNRNKKIFAERPFEKKFFKIIQIKKWKDGVPQFLKIKNINEAKKSVDVKNVEYLDFFVDETCRAELVHLFSILSGIVCWLFVPYSLKFVMGLPILFFWSIFNLLSVLIQRYNRPRLISLLNIMKKKQQNNLSSAISHDDVNDESLAKNEQ